MLPWEKEGTAGFHPRCPARMQLRAKCVPEGRGWHLRGWVEALTGSQRVRTPGMLQSDAAHSISPAGGSLGTHPVL